MVRVDVDGGACGWWWVGVVLVEWWMMALDVDGGSQGLWWVLMVVSVGGSGCEKR